MKNAVATVLVMVSLGVAIPRHVHAVSYPLIEEQREEKAAKGIREKRETVCLFQSGTAEIRKELVIGDVLIVYRQEKNGALRDVGKIKVLSYEGEDYLKGVVTEGEVMTGDVAKKGDIASLIISSEDKCKERGK